MSEGAQGPGSIDLRPIAAATAVVIGMLAMAALAYLLLDILLMAFMGIVVAAALQPWQGALCRWGVPKGVAVLLIYLLLLAGLVLVALVIGPVLVDQVGTFASEFPQNYATARNNLQASASIPFQFLGQRLPPFERLEPVLTGLAPQLYQGTVGVTTSIVMFPVGFVTVLAIAFYWTMEVSSFERLVLSLIAVERRPRALGAWREIESRMGGFMRGQGIAMLAIGVASAVGYAAIGLPNVLALGVLAGLLEAVPWIGPMLAVVPALLVALPLGTNTVLLVMGLAVLIQFFENNVLIPRIMDRAVGVSALVGLLAILAFGALYGIVGIFIAIPMAAVIQVLIDTMVVNVEPVAEPAGLPDGPWDDLRARVRALRQQARVRLRGRDSRMGIDPALPDHVVDAVDQNIEVAAARIEKLISVAEKETEPLAPGARAALVEKLYGATERLEQAVGEVEIVVMNSPATPGSPTDAAQDQAAEIQGKLDDATRRFTEEVQDAEALVVAARTEQAEVKTP